MPRFPDKKGFTSTNSSTKSKFVSSKNRRNSPSDVAAATFPVDAALGDTDAAAEEEEEEALLLRMVMFPLLMMLLMLFFPSNCSKPKSLFPVPANPMLFPSKETLGKVLGGLKEAKACSKASGDGCGQRLRRGGGRVGWEEESEEEVGGASSLFAASGGVRIWGSDDAMDVNGGAEKIECCIGGSG